LFSTSTPVLSSQAADAGSVPIPNTIATVELIAASASLLFGLEPGLQFTPASYGTAA